MSAIVVVGAPFETQTMYGPFEDFEAASEYADTIKNEYTWIVTLLDPKDDTDT